LHIRLSVCSECVGALTFAETGFDEQRLAKNIAVTIGNFGQRISLIPTQDFESVT
jgi:hypothetical protein